MRDARPHGSGGLRYLLFAVSSSRRTTRLALTAGNTSACPGNVNSRIFEGKYGGTSRSNAALRRRCIDLALTFGHVEKSRLAHGERGAEEPRIRDNIVHYKNPQNLPPSLRLCTTYRGRRDTNRGWSPFRALVSRASRSTSLIFGGLLRIFGSHASRSNLQKSQMNFPTVRIIHGRDS